MSSRLQLQLDRISFLRLTCGSMVIRLFVLQEKPSSSYMMLKQGAFNIDCFFLKLVEIERVALRAAILDVISVKSTEGVAMGNSAETKMAGYPL